MYLMYLSLAWVAGIFLGTRVNVPSLFMFAALIPLSLLFFRRYRKSSILVSLVLLIFFSAGFYSYESLHQINENDLSFYNDSGVREIRGIIARDPDVRDKNTHLYFSASEMKTGDEWHEAKGNVLILVPRYPAYRYGDVLLITGRLETPPVLDDFDYRGYLAHQGINSTMLYPKVEIIERDRGNKAMAWIYSLRNRLAETLARILPEPQASLAQGLALGIRSNMPTSIKADFTRTGTAHLLAISGLHLSIIAGIMVSLGIFLFGKRRYLYVWLALAVVWLYALITGMNPPVMRSASMASLFLLAELSGRQKNAFTALTFAAAVMVGISPYILGDAAFQLSFLAMAGLVCLYPPLQSLGRITVDRVISEEGPLSPFARFISDSLSATFAATIAVWPLVAYYFDTISFVGPFATLLVLPALPVIIAFSFLGGAMGLVFIPAAQVIGWIAWLFLTYVLFIVQVLAESPLVYLETSFITITFIATYYSILTLVIWLVSQRRRLSSFIAPMANKAQLAVNKSKAFVSSLSLKLVVPPLLTIAIAVSATAATLPDNKVRVSFLDVGQGDAILIEHGTQQILIDGGPSPQAISAALSKAMPFWDRSIDLVVSTHPDADHLAGLIEVLKRYHVAQVLQSTIVSSSPLAQEWQSFFVTKRIASTIAQAGQRISLGDEIALNVLNPLPELSTEAENGSDTASIVLRLQTGKISFLFTADSDAETERALIMNRSLPVCTVLKAAHHGSATATTSEFLSVVSPEAVVISVGAENRYHHPSPEVMARLRQVLGDKKIYRTDIQGTIEFITDGERLWVKTDKLALE